MKMPKEQICETEDCLQEAVETERERQIGQAGSVTQVVLADSSHISAFVLKTGPFSRLCPTLE